MSLRSILKTAFEVTKDLSGVLSGLSLILGSLTLWLYLNSYGLLYLLSTDIELLTLLALFFAGYLISLSLIVITLMIVPLGIASLIKDFVGISSMTAAPSNLGFLKKITHYLSGLPAWWLSVFLSPFVMSLVYIISQNHKTYLYIGLISLTVLVYMIFITGYYQKYKLRVIKPLSEKFTFVLGCSGLILFNIFPLIIFIIFLSKTDVYNSWIQWLLLALLCLVYASALTFIAVQAANASSKIYTLVIVVVLFFTVLIHLIGNFALLDMTVSAVGIRDNSKASVYQFKSSEIDRAASLNGFLPNSMKLSKDQSKIYIRGYSIFRFRKTLILCPSKVTRQQIQENRYLCLDASGIEYKNIPNSVFEKL
jgi:hypothetical protein